MKKVILILVTLSSLAFYPLLASTPDATPFSLNEQSSSIFKSTSWIKVEGKMVKSSVEINWITQTAYPTEEYVIQRRCEGEKEWKTIATVRSNGQIDQEVSYQFKDTRLPDCSSVDYKIQEISHKKKKNSPVFSVELGDIAPQPTALLTPNPVENELTISVENMSLATPTKLAIQNAKGENVIKYLIPSLKYNQFKLELAHLDQGLYFIILEQDSEKISQSFLKK